MSGIFTYMYMIFLNVGKYASPKDAIMETVQYDFQFASIVHLPRCVYVYLYIHICKVPIAIVNSWMLYNLHQTESFLVLILSKSYTNRSITAKNPLK